eukprot:CAMPEP_0197438562 /NCGR_PEP_ID=MMETSP1175-20131217/5518_1 /TAXON_ID=1003142 /ORGANISM="Triceratium dubium, Strain CCMP147" /LENGTH=168 /DNA_ID=CAMNT_0042968313 /DNA_START=565 /DNA_END=1067 /DNA_ORIENTATION=+
MPSSGEGHKNEAKTLPIHQQNTKQERGLLGPGASSLLQYMFMNDLAAVRNNRPASAEMMNLPRDDGDDYRGSMGLSEQERRRRATAARAQAQAQAHAQLQALQRQQQGQSVAAAAAASRGGAVAVPLNPRAREPSDGTTAAAVHGLLNLTPSARRGTGLSEADPSLAA